MKATEVNEKTARAIINALAENGCTVSESTKILRYVEEVIKQKTTVQKVEKKLFDPNPF